MVSDKDYMEKILSQKKKLVFRYDKEIMRDILEFKSSGKVLDLGCGSGGLSLDLAMKGFEVFCVDISETAIKDILEEAVRRGVKVNAVCEDLENYKFIGEYDIIIVCGVLQFLGEGGENFVHNVMKHTKRGGINVLDVFRNKFLPSGKLEEFYSGWKVLEKEEYVWEKDNFAKMIYLVVQK